MGPPLSDDIWTRRGITLLWDADKLSGLYSPDQIISLRQFLQLHKAGWPESELHLVGDTTLVVAGLEGCLDALPPQETETWLEQVVYPAILSYHGKWQAVAARRPRPLDRRFQTHPPRVAEDTY